MSSTANFSSYFKLYSSSPHYYLKGNEKEKKEKMRNKKMRCLAQKCKLQNNGFFALNWSFTALLTLYRVLNADQF